jgi:hypothetical protein
LSALGAPQITHSQIIAKTFSCDNSTFDKLFRERMKKKNDGQVTFDTPFKKTIKLND